MKIRELLMSSMGHLGFFQTPRFLKEITSPHSYSLLSPVHLGSKIIGHEDQLMEVLQMFRQSTSSPLVALILSTPS
jgi:hypothetical protein